MVSVLKKGCTIYTSFQASTKLLSMIIDYLINVTWITIDGALSIFVNCKRFELDINFALEVHPPVSDFRFTLRVGF